MQCITSTFQHHKNRLATYSFYKAKFICTTELELAKQKNMYSHLGS